MDRLTGTRRELLLGNWLAEARAWGQSTGECDLCERNARELLTIWTSAYNISDYANRQWNGLAGRLLPSSLEVVAGRIARIPPERRAD